MSPPPREEADDYFAVHGPYNDGTRHQKNDRKHSNKREGIGGPTPREHTSNLRAQLTDSTASACEVCAPETSASHASLSRHDERLSCTSNIDRMGDITRRNTASARSGLSGTSSTLDNVVDSPAVNALRRFSQHQPSHRDSGSQGLRRMSTALSNTFHLLRSSTSVLNSHSSSNSASPRLNTRSRKRRSHRKGSAHRDADRHSRSPRENKNVSSLPTPSIITLRKASNTRLPNLPRSSMSASLSHEDERMRAPDAPASELLAFYSANLDKSGSLNQPKPPVKQVPESRRNGVLAATTITYTDVHVAPGTFTVGPKSRKPSLAVTDQLPRRISVVQFRSRDSVHEVVWREDETTSDSSFASSSRTSNSPKHRGQFPGSIGPSSAGKTSPTKENQNNPVHTMPMSSSMAEQLQGGLCQWSWTKPADSSSDAAQEHEGKGRPKLMQMTSASNPDLRRPGGFLYVLNYHRRSVSEPQDLLSSPPLRDRSSTIGWRKTRAVDFNDSSVSRTQSYGAEENKGSSGPGSGTSSNGMTRKAQVEGTENLTMLRESFAGRRASSHPYARARIGPIGRMGSSLGSSSHVRLSHPHRL